MIRPATPEDVPACARMLADFEAAAGVAVDGPGEGPDPVTFAATVRRLAAHRLGLALVLDLGAGPVGMLLAHAGPSPFRAALWADEVVFWIDPPARGLWAGRFLGAYEAWAAALGARVTGLSALDARTGRLFERRGYRPAERKFLRVI